MKICVRVVFLLAGLSVFMIPAGETPAIMRWITSPKTATPPDGFLTLIPAPSGLSQACISPDGKMIAELVESKAHHTVAVNLVEIKSGKTRELFKDHTRPNHFAPIDAKWSPDCKQLFVRFGYSDSQYGEWLYYDVDTGEMIEDKEALKRLKAGPTEYEHVESRASCYDRGMVWGLDGKFIGTEIDAETKKITRLLPTSIPEYTQRADTGLLIFEGKEYTVLADHSRPSGNRAYIMLDDTMIGVVKLAGPLVDNCLFININKQLILKFFYIDTTPAKGQTAYKPIPRLVGYALGDWSIKWVYPLDCYTTLLQLENKNATQFLVIDHTKRPR